MRLMKKYLIAFVFVPVFSFGQSVNWHKAEASSDEKISSRLAAHTIYPSWDESSSYLYYNVTEKDGYHLYMVNARTGKKEEMIRDRADFVNQYRTMTKDSTQKADDLRIYGIDFKGGDGGKFYWEHRGLNLVFDRNTGRLDTIAKVKKQEMRRGSGFGDFSRVNASADSVYTMLSCGYDLYVRNNKTGKTHRLTTNGTEECPYSYSFSKDTVSRAIGTWYGHRYVCNVVDNTGIKTMTTINSLADPRPTITTFKMPMPNDKNVRRYKMLWYDADKDSLRMAPIGKYEDEEVKEDYFKSKEWIYFTRKSRKSDKVDLCRLNIANGNVEQIITETCEPHINLTFWKYRIIDHGNKVIWWSERTGHGNFYLYDMKGKLLNRISRGKTLNAGLIEYLDTLNNEIIFEGYGGEPNVNPYYRYYYKAKFDGSKQQLLTPGDGYHEMKLSENHRYLVDECSRMDCVPTWSVVDVNNPKNRHEFQVTDEALMKRDGWIKPTMVKVKAADGKTDLYGVMYTPADMDATKKYPILSNVYPGPQDDQIPQAYTYDDNGNQTLANLGFVVITVADRGSSPYRGHDFYCFSYGNLRDYPLADDKTAIEQLAAKYSFIDLDRVGIFGHSGGGFQTVTAMLTYPDFYKVGVAASGNYDNNIYIQWWGETFHGLGAKIPTTMELAGNLKGKLMLITGDVDNNVPCSNTLRMAQALIEKNKRFDMFVLPGKDHGVQCPYYQNLLRYYFVENLIKPSHRDIDIIKHQ